MIDLHTHSTASDGSCTPQELVDRAVEVGLQAIALTDHDTVDGIEAFFAAANAAGIEPIAGIEISCSWYAGTLHMLGLLVDPDNAALHAMCARQSVEREKRLDRIVENLAAVDVVLDADSVRARADGAPVGRPHIADELIATGVCSDPQDVYHRFLGDKCTTFTKAWLPMPEEAIAVIHGAGGLALQAHPTGFGTKGASKLRQRTRQLVDKGMDGLEAWYGAYSPAQRDLIAKVAGNLNLVVSGGSDFHGPGRSHACLGDPVIGYNVLQKLKDTRAAKHGACSL